MGDMMFPHKAGKRWSRRHFLGACGAGLFAAAVPALPAQEEKKGHALASFDQEMELFMQVRKVPGGALAVVKHRQLVYARGYCWAALFAIQSKISW